MGRGGINERILTGIRESTDDNKLFDFLKDILFEEAEHPSQWWWKETYKKIKLRNIRKSGVIAMRIESVMLKNYRQFKDMEISFKKTSSQDLHVLIGVMGTGKTNLLNAINWCLYGDEPYLSKQSQQLPILNLKTIEEAEEGEDNDVIVEVSVQTEDNRRIIFTRKMIFRVYGVGMNPQKQDTIFEVKVSDAKGNMKILKDEDAQEWVWGAPLLVYN